MTSPIRIALIGVGGIGREHIRCLDLFEREQRLKLVAVADPAEGSLAEVRKTLTERGVVWFTDYQEMLRNGPALDAVVIAAPIPFHAEMVRACMKKNLFILLEKPPVPLWRDLEQLLENEAASRVAVGFQMICSSEIKRIKQWIGDGTLGEIKEIRAMACWPRPDRYYERASWAGKMTLGERAVFDGPSTNALAHLTNNAMFLAGETFTAFAEPVEVRGELYHARPIEGHDIACLQGLFASGLRYLISVTHAVEKTQQIRFEVHGTGGWARISYGMPGEPSRLESHEGACTDLGNHTGVFFPLYRDFVAFVEGKLPSPATRLSDTRGYLLATNGALISSGGIHSIAPAHIRRYGSGSESGYSVEGLFEAVQESFQTGRMFSELNLPWAVRSNPVSLQDVRKANLTCADLRKWAQPMVEKS